MEYTLKFTEREMVLLQIAIDELPEKPRTGLVRSINDQIAADREATASEGRPSTGPKG